MVFRSPLTPGRAAGIRHAGGWKRAKGRRGSDGPHRPLFRQVFRSSNRPEHVVKEGSFAPSSVCVLVSRYAVTGSRVCVRARPANSVSAANPSPSATHKVVDTASEDTRNCHSRLGGKSADTSSTPGSST